MIFSRTSKTWTITSWIIVLALLAPVLVMVHSGFYAQPETFSHLWQTVLPDYIANTLALGFIVTLLALLFGIPSAALIALTNIKSKSLLRWLLLLPLAMPAYLVAYLYTDLFDYAGPVQRFLRATFDWQSPSDYWFFDIRTLGGASVILALVLFPYVYMLVRTAFETQDQSLTRAGQSLGQNLWQCVFKISLPVARPAIAISASLVLMETLADFATVQYFAVNTLTTAVYDTWLEYGELSTANAIASILMLFVLMVVVAEQRARAKQRHQSKQQAAPNEIKLNLIQQLLALGFCWLLVVAGFLLPMALLLEMAWQYTNVEQVMALMDSGINSVKVAVYAASGCLVIALVISFYQRLHQQKFNALPWRMTGFGYAIPGTVVAMAMLATLGPLDHLINDGAKALSFSAPGLILSGSIFAVVFALVVRFAAIANGTINSGISRIPESLDRAPASLGVSLNKSIWQIHLPLVKSSMLVAWLLVFVEAMKELPAVLLLRPFNFDTLSTYIYQLISDEQLEQGAIGALLIVLFGLLPIVLLNKKENSH